MTDEKKQNVGLSNFKSEILEKPKQRNIFLVLTVISVVSVGGSLWWMSSNKSSEGIKAGASLPAISSVNTTPGVSQSQAYNQQVNQKNIRDSNNALQNGTSFVPTPTNTNLGKESDLEKIEKLAKENAEKDRLAKEEADRLAKEKENAEKDRLAKEEAEKENQRKIIVLKNEKQAVQQVSYNAKYNENDVNTFAILMGLQAAQKSNLEVSQESKSGNVNSNVTNNTGLNPINAQSTASEKVLVKAGVIIPAILETNVNSDEPSPVIAKIIGGEFNGTRVLGGVSRSGEKVILSFSTANLSTYKKSIKINAIAMDPNSKRTALASDVNNHNFLKYGVLLGSAFLSGYSDAIVAAGTTSTVNSSGNVVTTTGALTDKEIAAKAFGGVGKELANQARNTIQGIQPTITVNAGTAIGLLIMEDLIVKENN